MANMKEARFSLKLRFLVVVVFMILVSCFGDGGGIDTHFHSVEIASFFPADVCARSTNIKGSSKRKSTLEVFHNHGPCSSQQHPNKASTTSQSLSEILSLDQVRVESIHTRLDQNSKTNKINNINSNSNSNKLKEKQANLPVQSGRSLGVGNYIVTVGLGTPKRSLSLMFDTGSDLTWTQCQPCIRSCYQQQDPIFDPWTSTSYKNISCNSAECTKLTTATGNTPGCSTSTCIYGIQYGDQSFSVGFFSRDLLTLSATDVFPSFLFGCGQNNQGLFGNTAGLLGLGRNALSIVSQTAAKYEKYFSYCLPPTSSSTGHLTLGKSGAPTQVQFTSLNTTQGSAFYFIDIVSISVGGRQLAIGQSIFQAAGGIIDSGTVITRLPPAAYKAVSAAFQKLMAKYPVAPAFSLLDTCYDLSGYKSVSIPTVSFTFGGNVKIDLDPRGILVAVAKSQLCLAFAANSNAGSVAIYGNTQQKTFEVVYDVGAGKVGFAAAGCK